MEHNNSGNGILIYSKIYQDNKENFISKCGQQPKGQNICLMHQQCDEMDQSDSKSLLVPCVQFEFN